MQFLLLGLVLLVLVLLGGRSLSRANPKTMAKTIRTIGGWAALFGALGLIVTGRLLLALPLAMLGYSLLGKSFSLNDPFGSARKTAGQRSSVRTDMLEMTLDHDSGEMEGTVRKGAFAGRRLSALSEAELGQLLAEANQQDPQAAQLLEAYLTRRQSGSGSAGAGPSAQGTPGAMTLDEAYAVLGLPKSANREDIQQAHRNLMKKYHPDQGGTTYLASKINEAKGMLLKHVP